MKIERLKEIETTNIQIGDRLRVDHYTATCQKVSQRGAIFAFDQYLDKPMPMDAEETNEGGYESSDLRKALQSDEVLDIFNGIRDYMIPFENGDLIRVPFAGELFGDGASGWCDPDGHEQWPLMRDQHGRTASRCGKFDWGWLQNTDTRSSSRFFCVVDAFGNVYAWKASGTFGVRPVFMITEEAAR